MKHSEKSHSPVARILIVDDHPMVRGGVMRLIDSQKDLACCGEAATAAEAMALARSQKPDLAIVDLRLKHGDALDLIKSISAELPSVRVLVLSQHTEPLYIERSFRAGARGYIAKDQDPVELLRAVRAILKGEMYLAQGMATRLLTSIFGNNQGPAGTGLEQLTDRELGVLQLLGEGKGTRQIAAELNLSYKTIESHRENLKHKLKLGSASELVHFAIRWASQPATFPSDKTREE